MKSEWKVEGVLREEVRKFILEVRIRKKGEFWMVG